MKNYKASFFALSLFLICGVYTQACETFQEANQAYFQGDFQTAIDKYEQCESKSFEVLYNLGNAYFKAAQLGKSIQYYRKAQQLNPEDENLRYNLEFASKQTVDEEDYGQFPLAPEDSHYVLLKAYGLLLLVLVFFLGRSKVSSFPAFAFFVVFLGFIFSKREVFVEKGSQAVVLTKEVKLRSNRNRQAAVLVKIHEGKMVRILDQADNWYLVEVSRDLKGWVQLESLGKV